MLMVRGKDLNSVERETDLKKSDDGCHSQRGGADKSRGNSVFQRDDSTTHFPGAGDARTNDFYEGFRRISSGGIKLQWQIVLRFQSACNG